MDAVRICSAVTGAFALAEQVPRPVQLHLELREPGSTGFVQAMALPTERTLLGDERTDVVADLIVLVVSPTCSCPSSAPSSLVIDDGPAPSTLARGRSAGLSGLEHAARAPSRASSQAVHGSSSGSNTSTVSPTRVTAGSSLTTSAVQVTQHEGSCSSSPARTRSGHRSPERVAEEARLVVRQHATAEHDPGGTTEGDLRTHGKGGLDGQPEQAGPGQRRVGEHGPHRGRRCRDEHTVAGGAHAHLLGAHDD